MKVGILGAGAMGRTVVGHLQQSPDVKEIVAYDISTDSLKKTHTEFAVSSTDSLNQILDDEAVKVVFITAANGAHKELALASLEAGKAVMCEKPMANSLEESREMAETAERLNGFLQIGFELRYSHLYAKTKHWIDEGRIGQIRNLHCNYITSSSWLRDSWRTRKQQGGSMFGEKLSHYVDLPRWWTGSEVTEVHATSAPNVIPFYEVRDNYHSTCTFENGTVSHLTFIMPFASTMKFTDPLIDRLDEQKDLGYELRYLIVGTEGAIETNVFRRTLKHWVFKETEKGFSSDLVETHTWKAEQDQSYIHNTCDQTHDIIRRVRDGLPPSISPWDALETMKVCEAAELSAEQNRPVPMTRSREVAVA
ncbi:MAG: Gfo/Idh/MocA family protein [Chthoniobacterales bacterium]